MEETRRVDVILSSSNFANLDKCKVHFGQTTNSAAIRDVITAYPRAMERIDELERKLSEANRKLAERDSAIHSFVKSLNVLNNLK